jgi:hypothetical protein
MSMNAGRLIFSKPRHANVSWETSSDLDDRTFYVCEKQDYGGWLAKVGSRLEDQRSAPPLRYLVERTDIGWRLKLVDAKRLCDQHHHKAILASDDESLKGYVQRWPL